MYKRQKWTSHEDQLLSGLVEGGIAFNDWEAIADEFRKRGLTKNSKQIKTRWTKNLTPDLNKEKWGADDLNRLFAAYAQTGNKWCKIAESFEGRTDNCIKNQFFSCIRKALRFIMKASNQKLSFSCTKAVNEVKPKVLSQFIDKTVRVKNREGDAEIEIQIIDVVKAVLCENQNLALETDHLLNTDVLSACIDILLASNDEYIAKKLSKKRRARNSAGDSQSSKEKYQKLRVSKFETIINGKTSLNRTMTEQKNGSIKQIEDTGLQINFIVQSINEIRNLIKLTHISKSGNEHSTDTLAEALTNTFGQIENLAFKIKNGILNLNDRTDERTRVAEIPQLLNSKLALVLEATPDVLKNSETKSPMPSPVTGPEPSITEPFNSRMGYSNMARPLEVVNAKISEVKYKIPCEFPRPQVRSLISTDHLRPLISKNSDDAEQPSPDTHQPTNGGFKAEPLNSFHQVLNKWNIFGEKPGKLTFVKNLCFEMGQKEPRKLDFLNGMAMKKIYSASLVSRGK